MSVTTLLPCHLFFYFFFNFLFYLRIDTVRSLWRSRRETNSKSIEECWTKDKKQNVCERIKNTNTERIDGYRQLWAEIRREKMILKKVKRKVEREKKT